MDNNDNLTTNPVDTQPGSGKGKKKLIWIATAVLVLVIGAVGVFAYTQIAKNPMALYVKAEKNTFEDLWSFKDDYYGDKEVVNDKLLTKAYESTLELSASAELPPQLAMQDPMIGMAQGLLSSFKIILDTKINPETKEAFAGIDFNMSGTSLIDAQVYQNKEITGATVPVLYDKYFVFDNNKLGEFLNANGLSQEVPLEAIPHYTDMRGLTSEELKGLSHDYLDFLGDYISSDQVSVTRNVERDGKEYTKAEIHFSEKETQELLKALFEKMKTDDRLNFYFYTPELQEQAFNEIIASLESLTLPNGMTYEAYIADDYVAYRTLTIEATDGSSASIDVNSLIKGNDQYEFVTKLTLNASAEEEVVMEYIEDGKPDGDQYNVDRVINFAYADSFVDESFGLDATTAYKDNTAETAFNLNINSTDLPDMPTIGGTFNTSVKDNGETAEKTFELGIDVNVNDPYVGEMAFNVTLNGDNQITFTDDLEFPTVDDSNSVKVFELTPQEMEQIAYEIQQNAVNLMSYFGGFGY